MMVNLKEYKDLKRAKIIYKDLLDIKVQLTTCIEALRPYGKYVPVADSISALHNSRTLVEIHLGKFKRLVEQTND